MASTEVNPNLTQTSGKEPELHLLLAPDTFEPLWKSLFRGLDDFFFPKKLPPLKLESKPIPVKDIWGFYNYKKNGALGSTAAHVIVLGLIIGGTILGRHFVTKAIANPQLAVEPTVIVPPDIKVAMNNMPNLGDPKSSAVIPSNGTGSGSGIGSGF